MRAFAACFSIVLGLGAFSVVACSSDATTTAAGGEAGEAPAAGGPSAGGGGATSSGGATGAAGAGEAGASSCSFDSPACATCLQGKCGNEVGACITDNACSGALTSLEGCACDASKTIDECETAFGTDGGDPAAPLVTCFNANCATDCQ